MAAARRAGLTQRELARQAGVSAETVWRAKSGERTHPGTTELIAEALGCTICDLWPAGPVKRHAPPFGHLVGTDPISVRRETVGRLCADLTPGEIASCLDIGRATVYRDIEVLRATGWRIPARPMGRPRGPHAH